MTAFEYWADGLVWPDHAEDLTHQREFYISLILPGEKLIERWNKLNYSPPEKKEGQLKLF